MAADGFLNFDTRINTNGFQTDTKKIGSGLKGLISQFRGLGAAIAAAFSVRQIASFVKESKELYKVQLEAETKIETVLGRNLGATEEQIEAVEEWASELQKVGVIGDEIQLSGLQELSTYIENADSLRTMNVVLNDMLAQQYGLNATAEEAVTISTMLGKVLEGQTSALSRYGYSFNEAQEQLLKFGTEEQRVATLAEVVEASVGGINEALARTPAGRLKQVSNTLGDIKEQFGKAFINIQALFVPALEEMASLLERIADLAVVVSEKLANIFGVELSNVQGIGSTINESVDYQEDLTTAVEETAENQQKSLEIEENSLANFDQINTVTTKTVSETEPEKSPAKIAEKVPVQVTPAVADKDVETAADKLTDKLSELLKPVRVAWKDNSPQLIANAQRAAKTVKGLFASVGDSIAEVWTNGSGERFVANMIVLFSDLLGIIGDVAQTLKNAWDEDGRGTALVQSYADRWNSLLELIHEVSQSFRDAWNDGTGEEIFGNILDIITNINNIWTNLRTQFSEAWTENDRGTRIFSGILGIVNSILGMANRISRATADWAKKLDFGPMLESIGGLLEAVEPLTDNIGDGLAWFYENVLLPLGKWTLEKAVPTFLELLASAIKAVNAVLTVLKPAAQTFIDKFLKPIASWTGGVIVTVLGTLSEALSNIADWIMRHQELLSGIMTVIQNVAGAILTFFNPQLFAEEFRQISNSLIGAATTVWEAVTGVLASIGEAVRNSISGLIAVITEFGDFISVCFMKLYKFLSDIWNSIKKVYSEVGGWFKTQFIKARDNIKGAWSTAVKWFTDIWSGIKQVFSVVGNWFKDQFTAAWNNIVSVFKGIGSWFGERWNEIVNIFSVVGTWFGDRFREGWNSITGIFNGIHGYFSDRLNDIHNIFGGIGDWFGDKFGNAWNRVKDAFSGVRDFFSGLWSDIANGARDGINWVIERLNNLMWRLQDGINNIVNGLNSALSIHVPDNVPGIGGAHFELGLPNVHIPQIPYLAQGTYVPANYGNFLAVLGDNKREPEIVSPVSSIKTAVREVIREQGGNDKPITVVCVLDGREIGRVAVNAVNRDKALKGG